MRWTLVAIAAALLAAAPAHAGWRLGFRLGLGSPHAASQIVLAGTGLEARQPARPPAAEPVRLQAGMRIQLSWDDAAQGVSIAWGAGR